jgi:tetratricopeptide (TPR) repeat protein
MTRHPTARRVHREDSTPDDAFVAGVLETSVWAQEHRKPLIIGAITVVVLVLATFLFMTTRANTRARAAEQLTTVRATALSGNNQLAIRDLEAFLRSFGGTPSAPEARLMLGRAYLDEGQPQKTIETLSGQAGDVGNIMGVNAALLVAAAHEAAQQSDRAEEVYLRIAEGARFLYQKQEALDNAARVRLERGNPAGAVELYQRLIELTPENDASRPVYELRASEARAAVTAGAPTAAPTTTTGN